MGCSWAQDMRSEGVSRMRKGGGSEVEEVDVCVRGPVVSLASPGAINTTLKLYLPLLALHKHTELCEVREAAGPGPS